MHDPNLDTTFAAWILLLARTGRALRDPRLAAARDAVLSTGADGAGLVEAAATTRGGGDMLSLASAAFGDAVTPILGAGGGPREQALAALRRAFFGNATPILVRLLERGADGSLVARWHILEALTGTARLLDTNPWDDVAEERDMDVSELALRWELAGYESIALR